VERGELRTAMTEEIATRARRARKRLAEAVA
jgi:hypothetical protein